MNGTYMQKINIGHQSKFRAKTKCFLQTCNLLLILALLNVLSSCVSCNQIDTITILQMNHFEKTCFPLALAVMLCREQSLGGQLQLFVLSL